MIQIPNYEITETLFTSKGTRVFRGKNEVSGKTVILRTCGVGNDIKSQESRLSFSFDVLEMFEHPNIVKAIELVQGSSVPCMVMEDISGVDLRHYAKQFEDEQLPVQEFLDIAIQLTDALDVIHHAQVIHKDLHPGNIVINPESRKVQIIDFGLASLLTREQPAIVEPDWLEGALSYISPEQTGRMNRALDYRSDFYTLGVTFYQLLTGSLPFDAEDALGMVYSHIATVQTSAEIRRPGIPVVISAIINKMMMKNAEDRYQSAYGIKQDLLRCLRSIQKNGTVDEFLLATEDVSSRFCIPQTLYGRSDEIKTLLGGFDQVLTGKPHLLTVSGYSGIGKSALVHEIYKPIAGNNGVFLSGKFDQFQQNTPYSAIKTALSTWLKQELRLPEAKLLTQRKRIAEALGTNTGVLTEFMPEFEHLLGRYETPVKLGSQETLARFVTVFQSFINVVTEQRPWVLFIDDIQWADLGTLNLLPELLNEKKCRLLILLAYRDNEVDSQHPAQFMLNKIEAKKASADHIKLKPLKEKHIRLLITDTFHRTQADIQKLSDLVIGKTGGNPFFAIEFLKTLYRKELLKFDIDAHSWVWDLSLIEKESITDNVVELMLDRISELPENTRHLMQIASCVGTSFNLETLAVASQENLQYVANVLWQALKEGLLVQEGGDWFLGLVGGAIEDKSKAPSARDSFARSHNSASTSNLSTAHSTAIQNFIPRCRFLHDRMLQAAYESLAEEDRILMHLSIGWRFYESFTPKERTDRVFELVEQLNHGAALISVPEQRHCLIELNTLAAEKAKASSVWSAAEQYATIAFVLMGEDPWGLDYELSFKLQGIMAEAAYIKGEFESANARYEALVERARNALDKTELLTLRLVQAIGRSDYREGLRFGRRALDLLGINIPEDKEALNRLIAEQQTLLEKALESCPINNFHQLPVCTDRASQLAIYLLINFGLSGMLAKQHGLVTVGVQKSLLISIAQGRTDSTLVTLTSYGLLLVQKGAYKEAAEVGEKAKELLAIYPNCREAASVWNGIALTLNHLKNPLMESYTAYEKGFESGLQAGELARAGVCLSAKASIKAVAGYPIEECLAEEKVAEEFTAKKSLKVPFLPIYKNIWRSYLTDTYMLADEDFEAEELAAIKSSSFIFALEYYRFEHMFWKEVDCVILFDQLSIAYDSFKFFNMHFMAMDFRTLANLAIIRAQREGYFQNRDIEFKKWLEIFNGNVETLKVRAELNPASVGHKLSLVRAEQCALEGAPFELTASHYKEAIKGAEVNGFRQYAGLANELFARYLIEIGHEALADVPLEKAAYWYKRWGNNVKYNRLAEHYQLFDEQAESGSFAHSVHREKLASTKHSPRMSSTTSTSVSGDKSLDFQSIIKSMQTISGELDLHSLIENMIKVIIENAGAHIAVLAIQSNKGTQIEAHVDSDKGISSFLKHTPINQAESIPLELINLTLRLGEKVWLDDACSEGEFVDDLYVRQSKAKSVLCLPITYRNRRIGALYLENKLSTGAFTEARLNVLEVLLGQAAISLENARLFNEVTGLNAGLEAKVAQRTKDLDEANEELAAANKELESFSYTVSHDLKSPLRMIKGFSDILLEDYVDQLDEEAQRILGKVVLGAKSMEELINGLLDLSRMQRKEVVREALDLSLVANNVVDNLRDTYPERNVEVCIQDDIKVSGDARMMHSVVENLINNAWKYSGKTANPRISFSESLRYDDQGRPQRVFSVADNGAGFDMTHADKLFATFQRLHNKSDFDGTGVGLSTVKRIIEKHGGEVWAEAEVDKGATFYFTLG